MSEWCVEHEYKRTHVNWRACLRDNCPYCRIEQLERENEELKQYDVRNYTHHCDCAEYADDMEKQRDRYREALERIAYKAIDFGISHIAEEALREDWDADKIMAREGAL